MEHMSLWMLVRLINRCAMMGVPTPTTFTRIQFVLLLKSISSHQYNPKLLNFDRNFFCSPCFHFSVPKILFFKQPKGSFKKKKKHPHYFNPFLHKIPQWFSFALSIKANVFFMAYKITRFLPVSLLPYTPRLPHFYTIYMVSSPPSLNVSILFF